LIAGGLALVAMFALIVVAIDIGRISHTATEVQGIADSAALAGAWAVVKQGAGSAQAAATTAASDNRFDGQNFVAGTTASSTSAKAAGTPALVHSRPEAHLRPRCVRS